MTEASRPTPSTLDRAVQHRILEELASLYPYGASELPIELDGSAIDSNVLLVNIQYLHGHGLIKSGYTRFTNIDNSSSFPQLDSHFITEKGLDFLKNDGGLSAILGVVTVRLHEDTTKALIAACINSSSLPAKAKESYLATLRQLPGKATEKLVLKLVDVGWDNAPAVLAALNSLLFKQ